jgi:phosphotransferase system HPr-like phosphotransfer protein
MTRNDAQPDRPRVLYVDRTYDSFPQDQFAKVIADVLGANHEVDADFNLGPWVVERIRQALATRPYSALVTHAPNDHGKPSYGGTIEVLHDIRMAVDMPVITYTGATGPALYSIGEYVDRVIPKTMNCRKDIDAITSSLAALIERYQNRGEPPPPVFVTQDGFTTAELAVNLMGGFGLLAAYHVYQECENYPRRVLLQRIDEPTNSETLDCKQPLRLILLMAHEGARVRLSVEGEDAAAMTLANRLYGGLTSRYAFDMKWDRFDLAVGQ